MELTLSEDQDELRSVARAFLEARCPAAEVRRLEADPAGWSAELWASMAEMGWVGLALPGGGGDLVDLGVVFEELGRAVCPSPLLSTVALGAMTLADAGRLDDDLAEAVAAGRTRIGTALVDVEDDAVTATLDGARARLSGVVPVAYDVADAEVLVVAAGPVVVRTDADQPGLEVTRLATMSNDRLFELRLDGVKGDVVGDSAALVPPARLRATALRCAEVVGVMGRALEMAADYTRSRVQFGKPLGSFQSVQHRLADMLMDLEGTRLVAYRALWALTEDAGATREVAVAKAWAAEACQRVAFGAQQVHGGIGVDMDYDLQLYFRRAKALEVELGSAPQHRETVAATLGLR